MIPKSRLDALIGCGFAIALVVLTAMLGNPTLAAQPLDGFVASARQAPDLVFPDKPSQLPDSVPRMGLYKPEGAGPFPALILHHQCGGLGPNRSMLDWAKDALKRGYVVLMLDSFSQRGVDSVCMYPKNGVFYARGVRDAIQAAQHLRKFTFVDKKRIGHVGYSWGAMVSVLLASRAYSNALGGGRIAAFVSLYPGCWTVPAPLPQAAPFEIVNKDINRPLLVLLGGADTETPPSDCVPKLKAAKAAGAPVAWHLYPNATHCWDCWQWDGMSRIDFKGAHVEYRHDKAATKDSVQRAFRFLDRALGN